MKYLSICSGIEAATVAWHGLGWEPVGFSEIEAFPSAVLAHRFPDVPNFGDMTKFKSWNLNESDVSLLVGGTPCQSFSVAGLRKGLSDDRGNLALTFCEMADHFDPEWVLWENVPGVLSSKDNAFGCFLAGLCGADEPFDPNGKWDCAGLVSGPKRTIAWRVLDAQYFGVAQRRRRVFVLAVRGAGNWAAARALFPVGESVFWDSAPSRSKRERTPIDVVPSLTASGRGVERIGESRGQHPVVAVQSNGTPEIAPCLDASFGRLQGASNQDANHGHGHLIPMWWDGSQTASTITKCNASGAQRMPDKDNFGAVLQPILYENHAQDSQIKECVDVIPQINAKAGTGGGNLPIVAQPIAFQSVDHAADATIDLSPTIRRHDPMAVAFGGDIARTLQARHDSSPCADRGMDVVTVAVNKTVGTLCAEAGPNTHGCRGLSGSQTMLSGYIQPTTSMQVRRLTPVECERLQGFPDGWTAIPWRGKPAEDCPDGPRYKALGNSMAVPVMRWIGNRIKRIETI